MGLKDTLRARFDGMTATQQKAARFVLEHPNDVVTASMRTVSARVEIPPATLVRFAQLLGFDGWPELKAALVQDMGLGSEPYAHKARSLVDRARDGGLAGEIFAVHHQNLDATEHANGEALPRAVPTGEVVSTVSNDAMRLGGAYDVSARFAGAIASYVVIAVVLLRISAGLGLLVLIGVLVAGGGTGS